MELPDNLKREYEDCFSILDKNNDGFLSNEEVLRVIRNVQPLILEEDVAAFMEKGQIGGKADLPTFQAAMLEKMRLPYTAEQLREAFQVFDAEKTGRIDFEEFEQTLKVIGMETISEEHREDMLKLMNGESREAINYEQFIEDALEACITE